MKRGIVYGLIATVGLFALWFGLRGHDRRVDQSIATPSLGPDDRAKIVLDNAHHTVTRVDNTGIHKTFLNPHGPVSIVEKKDGSTVLIQRTWGTQLDPFVGAALGTDLQLRGALGLNLFYVQRWELGGGLLLSSDIHDTRAFAHIGYNAYGNVLVSLAIDNRKTAHIIASLKF